MKSPLFNPASLVYNKFDIAGDSRAADVSSSVGRRWKSGLNWWVQANMIMGQVMKLGGIFGTSGLRSDQWITNFMPSLLLSDAKWVVFGSLGGVVNDLSQANSAPYTDTITGVAVTNTNVALVTAQNKQNKIKLLLRQGKHVVIMAETGATGLVAASITALFEHNMLMREFALSTPNCYWLDLRPVLWDATTSTTAIAFKTGYAYDTTHFNNLGAYFGGKEAAVFFAGLFRKARWPSFSVLDNNAVNPRQLIENINFNTLTGGTVSGGFTLTGTVPAFWQLLSTLTTTNITVTASADPEGFGNRVKLAITTVGADTIRFRDNAIANSKWNLTDKIRGGIRCNVTAGSSKARVYWESIVNTGGTGGETASNFDGYATVDGPTEAYSYDFLSEPVLPNGTTKGFLTPTADIIFSAAGNATVEFFQPTYERVQ